MERDDIYEYSLDTHHNEAEGVNVRKKIYKVLFIMSAITIFEVALGLKYADVASMHTFLKYLYILLTVIKAGYIVWVFMHLGDEKKSLQYTILGPYVVLIGYLIYIALTEALYLATVRPTVEQHYGAPVHHSEEGAAGGGEYH